MEQNTQAQVPQEEVDDLRAMIDSDPELASLAQDLASDPEIAAIRDVGASSEAPKSTVGKIAKDIGVGVTEIPGQINRGVVSAVNQTGKAFTEMLTRPALKWVHHNVMDLSGVFPATVADGKLPDLISENTRFTPQATTVTGNVVKNVAQFATAYYTGGRIMKAMGYVAPSGLAAIAGHSAARGAGADMTAFDPNEERLSNMLENVPILKDTVYEFLAAKEGDADATGRFKNAVEGLGLGMAMEGLFHSLRMLRASRNGDAKAFAEAHADMEKAGVPDSGPDITKDVLDPANDNIVSGVTTRSDEGLPGAGLTADKPGKAANENPHTANDNAGVVKDGAYPDAERMAAANDGRAPMVADEGLPGAGVTGERPQNHANANAPPEGIDEAAENRRASVANDTTGAKPEGVEKQLPKMSEADQAAADAAPLTIKDAPEAKAGEVPKAAEGAAPAKDGVTPPEAQKPKRPIIVDEDAARKHIEFQNTETAFGEGRNISGIRTDLIESGVDLDQAMSATQRLYREEIEKLRSKTGKEVVTHEMVRKVADDLADTVGVKSEKLMEVLGKQATDMDGLASRMLMARDMLTTAYTKLAETARLVENPLGPTGPYKDRGELLSAFVRQYEIAANIQAMYRGSQTNIARALNAMRIVGKNKAGALADLDPAALKEGSAQMEAMARDIAAAATTPTGKLNAKGVSKAMQRSFAHKLVDGLMSFRVAAMLSSPRTIFTNILTPIAVTALRPAERMMAGALRVGSEAGRREFVEGGLQYLGLAMSIRDGISLAAKTFRTNAAQLDPGKTRFEHGANVPGYMLPPSQRFGITDPGVGMVADALGTTVDLPSRFMMTGDEFVKQLSYRSEVRAAALREAIAEGSWKSGDFSKFSEIVGKRLDESVDIDGRALNEFALEKAREATFTADLKAKTWFGHRTIGETLQAAKNTHPSIGLLLPFVRTPTNLMRFAWDRTPGLNLLRAEYSAALSGSRGKAAQAEAGAKMAMGLMLWSGALLSAADGNITGGGPSDPKQRKLLEETGWRPYSIRVPDGDGGSYYFSYQKLDPFAMILGIVGDAAEAYPTYDNHGWAEAGTQAVVAVVKQLGSKSYLQGLTVALDALSAPDRNIEKFLKGLAASFAPNIIKDMNADPHMREARSVWDAVKRKTPGYSTELDPVRDVFGTAKTPPPALGPGWLSPITMGHSKDPTPTNWAEWRKSPRDSVRDEVARLAVVGDTSVLPPPIEKDGVDLTEHVSPVTGFTAYDRWQELTGTIKVGGKTLEERLGVLMSSNTYKNVLTDGSDEFDGSRMGQVKKLFSAYRQAALHELGKEDPALGQALIAGRVAKGRALVQQQRSASEN